MDEFMKRFLAVEIARAVSNLLSFSPFHHLAKQLNFTYDCLSTYVSGAAKDLFYQAFQDHTYLTLKQDNLIRYDSPVTTRRRSKDKTTYPGVWSE
jgi:hypothetical protein